MPVGPGVVGVDRDRLHSLRSASITALAATESLRPHDPLAGEAWASLSAAATFLRGEFIPLVDAAVGLDALTRPVPVAGLHGLIALLRSTRGARVQRPRPAADGSSGRSVEAVLTETMRSLTLDRAAHDLDHPFWETSGRDLLDELHDRLRTDPGSLDRLLGSPAALAFVGLLLDRDLDVDTRAAIAGAVLRTRFPDHVAETPLADAVVELAVETLHEPELAEAIALDTEGFVAIIERRHARLDQVGTSLGTVVRALEHEGWPEQPTLDLLRSLAAVARAEPFRTDRPPTALALPIATLTGALLHRLAAGRTPGGHLYPTVDDQRSATEPLDRDALRELIGIVLHDEAATTKLFVDLRHTLRDAVSSERPWVDVDRADDIARLVDDAVVEEEAELAALAAARIEWTTSMLGGLDGVARSVGGRFGALPGTVAFETVDLVQSLGARLVETEALPIDGVRSYYELARTFEIGRRGVLDAPTPTTSADRARLDAARTALATIEERIDVDLEAADHEANVAWLEFEDASAPFADHAGFPTMSW